MQLEPTLEASVTMPGADAGSNSGCKSMVGPLVKSATECHQRFYM